VAQHTIEGIQHLLGVKSSTVQQHVPRLAHLGSSSSSSSSSSNRTSGSPQEGVQQCHHCSSQE
jgi:hypothetical protein